MNYEDMTVVELKRLVKERGIQPVPILKGEIIEALELYDEAENGDPANFANMPDEVTPAPDRIEEEPVEDEPVEESPLPPPVVDLSNVPKIQKYKLMNDVLLTKPDGTCAQLKAGRIICSPGHDIDRIRLCGGVLAPQIEE